MGAVKADAAPGNPHGMWLIPKNEIDTPTMIREVATLTKQLTPADLEKVIGQAIAHAVRPLQEQINKLTQQLEKAEKLSVQNAISTHKKLDDLISESRAERQAKKSWWKFWD